MSTAEAQLATYSDTVQVFEPRSAELPPVREYLDDVWRRRHFIVALARADLKGATSNRLLGQLWGLLDPLFQAAIYLFLITLIRGGRGEFSATESAALIIFGIFMFNQVRAAVGDAGREIIRRKGYILTSSFPMLVFPLTSVYTGLQQLAPAMAIYAVLHVLLGLPVGIGICLLPLLFGLQLILGLGVGLLVGTATVFVRDLSNAMNYLLRILFFMTPVIYPVSTLESVSPVLAKLLWLNPFFPVFAAYQTILLGGVPSAAQVFVTAAWAALFIVIGYRVFVSHERAFAIRL
jgi:ABC-type polysaccharide/polyol phosphate export permease